MRFLNRAGGRFVAVVAALALASGVGVAFAATGHSGHSGHMDMSAGHGASGHRGVDEFGMTETYFNGRTESFTYTKGYFCDTGIPAKSSTRCEAGAKYDRAPSRHHDPLYILVPLGFKVSSMSMECPSGLVCVDHPGTIDLTRLEPALKPLYPDLSKKKLLTALANFETPGHQHFITDDNGGKPEWWDVRVVGVTDMAEYQKIVDSKSADTLLQEVQAGKTTPVIPTNLFLYFSVN